MGEEKTELQAVGHIDTEVVHISGELRDNPVLLRAAEILKSGRLVAFPTETGYGLGCDATNTVAARAVYLAKGRPSDNPLIIHLSSPDDAAKYCITTPIFDKLTEAFSPGPITVIMKKRDCIPAAVTGGGDTVAVRIPSNPIARELIRLAGVPVAAPSANLSGHPSPTAAEHVIRDLYGRVDMIIAGEDAEIGLESTVVKPDGGRVTVLRPGGVTYEQLCELLGEENVALDPAVTEKAEGEFLPMSPGMKYRHYAPRARVVLLDGDSETVRAFMLEHLNDERTGILCCEEDLSVLAGKFTVSLGSRDDQSAQAHRLFACLRSFDDMPVDVVYAPVPDRNGVGLAVYNRLMKASGFCVKKTENGTESEK